MYLIVKNIWQQKDSLYFNSSAPNAPVVLYCIILVWWHTDLQLSIFCLSRVGKTTGFLTKSVIVGALNKFKLTNILQLFIST